MAKVAFLGLGVMGFPMAGHLQAKGHEVVVWNRTGSKSELWVQTHGGRRALTAQEAVKDADFILCCVGNDDDLWSVCTGDEGAFVGMKKGAIFIDHTTVSSQVTQELAALAEGLGFGFIDAPVSGGQAGAQNGVLSIMCGGKLDHYVAAEPVMAAYGRAIKRLGESGAGQLAKMVNQIAIAGLVQGLSEAMHFAQKAGLDAEAVVEVIAGGAAGSWQMVNRHKTMLAEEFDFGFAVDWMRKDLGICLQTADEIGASLPGTAMIDQYYKDVQAMGGGRWDTSSLIARLNAFAKLKA